MPYPPGALIDYCTSSIFPGRSAASDELADGGTRYLIVLYVVDCHHYSNVALSTAGRTVTSHRPTGVTLLALVPFAFFLSAIRNLLVWRSLQPALFPAGSQEAAAVQALTEPLFDSLVSLYGVTALGASISAWRMLPWMSVAFLIWCAVALLLGAFVLQVIPAIGGAPAAIALVAGLAVILLILWAIYRYLRRVAPRATHAAL